MMPMRPWENSSVSSGPSSSSSSSSSTSSSSSYPARTCTHNLPIPPPPVYQKSRPTPRPLFTQNIQSQSIYSMPTASNLNLPFLSRVSNSSSSKIASPTTDCDIMLTPTTVKSMLQTLGEDQNEDDFIESQQNCGNFVPPLPLPSPHYPHFFPPHMSSYYGYGNNMTSYYRNSFSPQENFESGEVHEELPVSPVPMPMPVPVSVPIFPRKANQVEMELEKSAKIQKNLVKTNSSSKRGRPKLTKNDDEGKEKDSPLERKDKVKVPKVTEEMDEETKRKIRREKNKAAAARCRKRRVDRTNELQEETQMLENEKKTILMELIELEMVQKEYLAVLEKHSSQPCALLQEHEEQQRSRQPSQDQIMQRNPPRFIPISTSHNNNDQINDRSEVPKIKTNFSQPIVQNMLLREA